MDGLSLSLESLRTEYSSASLEQDNLPCHPFELFQNWFNQAVAMGLPEPNAMVVATQSSKGPSMRTVLLKKADRESLVFFTHHTSRKASQLLHSPQIALLFPWHMCERQVMVEGTAILMDKEMCLPLYCSL